MMFPKKVSRILLTFGVRDMGRISAVIDFGGCAYGIGVTCAFFQSIGILPSDCDLLNIALSGGPIRPAKSLNTQLGRKRLDQWICGVLLSSIFSPQLPVKQLDFQIECQVGGRPCLIVSGGLKPHERMYSYYWLTWSYHHHIIHQQGV